MNEILYNQFVTVVKKNISSEFSSKNQRQLEFETVEQQNTLALI